ncbi:NupC/NupG family nucleoside CNT transporter [Pirellulaceae bacterium SH449]
MKIVMGIVGMAVLMAIAVAFSSNRRAINVRTVLGAFLIQLGLGAFVLFTPWGKKVLESISGAVAHTIAYGEQGISFVFGPLVNNDLMETTFGAGQGFVLAFRVLTVIIFFSSLISVLYYLGVMQLVIRFLGGALQKLLGTSRTESMSATANIFVGQTEAPLVVRPYISKMTESELFAVMCGGLASVAGSVLAAYASMGVKMEYLIAASFMAAPGGLLFAKLLIPETEKPNDDPNIETTEGDLGSASNVIDAAAMGAGDGLKLALNVGAMLLAFVGLIALINGMLGFAGSFVGMPSLSLEWVLGKVFAPLAFLIGVSWEEASVAGSFIGQKLIVNEFVAYLNFKSYLSDTMMIDGVAMSEHTKAIISFALCGFANLSSIAILIGGLGAMAPDRRQDIARLGLKAVLAGTLSNLMSGTIAGFFVALSSVSGGAV